MSNAETTIKPKPEVSESLEAFIAGNQNAPEAPAVAVVQPASQPASLPAAEPTAMLSVRIPASLHRQFRVHSVTINRNIQDIVTELLTEYLAGQQPSEQSSIA